MPTDVDKLIEAGHDINSFGPAVLAQLVQAGVLTANEARRALRLPPKSYQEAGEKVLYPQVPDIALPPGQRGSILNGPPSHSEAPPVEEYVDEGIMPPPKPTKTVYRPTTPPKRSRPVKARPEYGSKFPPSFKQQGLLEHMRRESGLSATDLDAIAIEEAREYSRLKNTSDAKFVTGWYMLSKMVASRVIDRLSQDAPENDNQDEDGDGPF